MGNDNSSGCGFIVFLLFLLYMGISSLCHSCSNSKEQKVAKSQYEAPRGYTTQYQSNNFSLGIVNATERHGVLCVQPRFGDKIYLRKNKSTGLYEGSNGDNSYKARRTTDGYEIWN